MEPDNRQHNTVVQLQAVELSSATSWHCILIVTVAAVV